MIFGVDTSYANGSPDWNLALDDTRVEFGIARVCYGTNPEDDDGVAFVSAHDAFKGRGRPFGGYLFWLMGEDGAAQAEHFLRAADGRFGTISPVVDVEEGSGALGWGDSVEERIENLASTLDGLQKKLGQPIIYTNPDTWATYFASSDAFSGHRLWLADYSVPAGQAAPIAGFREIVLHQFSDGTGLPPIAGLSTPDNNVDRDVLFGVDFGILAPR